ncbi:MAG: DNA helicase RecQ [Alkalispirochaeta sp.]
MKREITRVLKSVFGFSSFRPHQEEIVAAILGRRDLFAALPTGGGKSLCYQLPAMLLDRLTVVVSPLIALMVDQVEGARQMGISAAFLNSSLNAESARDVYRRAYNGEIRLLYVSPERLSLESFRGTLQEWGVSLFAIDEAHCISEWGHEFRPEYRNLTVLRREFPDVPIAAFTATATPRVQADVVEALNLADPLLLRGNFDRPEIFYRVRRKDDVLQQIAEFIIAHPDEPGIVYRATRKGVDETVAALKKRGISALPYHAGLSDADRRRNQRGFVRDTVQVVVATIAFGMGIDKGNVRWVVHGDLPRSVEAYYQETGRAGRDGERADTCLFYSPGDIAKIRYHIQRMEVAAEREQAERNLREVLRFVESGTCRRSQLLRHFAQNHEGSCAGCDICTGEVTTVDETEAARKAMSAILRTGERFGGHYIARVVAGEGDERIERFGHHRLPTFGVGSDRSVTWWITLIADLESAGLLQRRDGPRSGLVLTPAGGDVLFGRASFVSGRIDSTATGTSGKRRSRPGTPRGRTGGRDGGPSGAEEGYVWREDQEALFQCLRRARKAIADRDGVPPYLVFSDKTLKAIVRNRPASRTALLRVHGVGEHKAERYGDTLLAIIEGFLATGECGEQ